MHPTPATIDSWTRYLAARQEWLGRDKSRQSLILGTERLPEIPWPRLTALRDRLRPLEDQHTGYRGTTTLRVDVAGDPEVASLAFFYQVLVQKWLGPEAALEAALYQVKAAPGPGSAFGFEKLWHFDDTWDRIKIWILLEDVADNAPTEVMLGSHRDADWRWPLERELLEAARPDTVGTVDIHHYGTLLDHHADALAAEHGWDRATLAGPAGTVWAWDTRLLHRGRELAPGQPPRRMLTLSYTTPHNPRDPRHPRDP